MTTEPDGKEGKREQLLMAGRAASAGYFFIVAMALGGGAGWLVDHYAATGPWGMLVGFLLGCAAGFRELYAIGKRTSFKKDGEGP